MLRLFCDCNCDFLTQVKRLQRFLGPQKCFSPLPQRALRSFFVATKSRKRLRFFCGFSRRKASPLWFGGGRGPAASPRRPLETVLRLFRDIDDWFPMPFCLVMCYAVLLCSFVLQTILAVMFAFKDRLKAGPTSWGLSDLSGKLFGYCATGGGYHGGGVFGPLGTMVPWGDSPREGRAAHGPLHPAV